MLVNGKPSLEGQCCIPAVVQNAATSLANAGGGKFSGGGQGIGKSRALSILPHPRGMAGEEVKGSANLMA